MQERLNTAKSEGSQVGITFYDQGQPANPNAAHPKTGRGALPAVQSSELVEAASELAAAAKKLVGLLPARRAAFQRRE